jgi:CRP/FNR family transcriptional regulator
MTCIFYYNESMDENLVSFKPGALLLMRGEKPKDRILIVKSGSVRTVWDADPLPELTAAGTMIGLVSAFLGLPPIETVSAATETTVFILKKTQFNAFFQANPSIVFKVIQTMAQRRYRLEMMLAYLVIRKEMPSTPPVPKPTGLVEIGRCYEEQGWQEVAYHAYKRYLSYYPNGPDAASAQDRRDALAIHAIDLPEYERADINRTYPKGSIIFFEGEPGDMFYLIQSGFVRAAKIIDGKRVFLGIVRNGNTFGESVLFSSSNRNYTAIAKTDVVLRAISLEGLNLIIANNQPLATHLMRTIAGRIWYITAKIQSLSAVNCSERIYNLLRLALEVAHLSPETEAYRFFFSQEELLDMTGFNNDEGSDVMRRVMAQGTLVEQEEGLFCPKISTLTRAFAVGSTSAKQAANQAPQKEAEAE